MQKARTILFGLILIAGVAAAVTTLVAQPAAPERRVEPRSRLLMLDGRGGQIGVTVDDLTAEELKSAGSITGGVRIDDVDDDSPASKAGLRAGDIVVELDGERVRSARQFSRLIQETPEGRSVKLGIVRGAERQTVDVTPEHRAFSWSIDGDRIGRQIERSMRDIGPRIEERLRDVEPRTFRWDGPAFEFSMPMLRTPRGRLGVELEDLSTQLAQYFGVKDGGVLVSNVITGSAAEKAGLKAGDVITSINGRRVRGYDDLRRELADAAAGDVAIGIVRDKKESTVKATLEDTRTRTRRFSRPV